MSSRRRGRGRKRSAPGSARSSGALGFGLAVGAAASVLLGAHFAKRVLTPAPRPENGVTVLTLEPSETSPGGMRVWLRGPDADLEGEYSFIFDARSRETQHLAGHARLGPVLRTVRTVGGVCVLRDELVPAKGVVALSDLTESYEQRKNAFDGLAVSHRQYEGDAKNWVRRVVKPNAKLRRFFEDHRVRFSVAERASAPMFNAASDSASSEAG
ncbi:MAG: hypothetical protein LCH31_11515 [Actinobacteria bacterium]|nr:hypothetical protein [Actinomycetota bacterium]